MFFVLLTCHALAGKEPEGITKLKTQVIIQKEDCLRGFER
jgi:hypothetical protein